jgi:tetratricopeptide (TPR) repeat protein
MHPDYAACLYNIGNTYQRKGDYNKALGYYFKSIEIMKIVLG